MNAILCHFTSLVGKRAPERTDLEQLKAALAAQALVIRAAAPTLTEEEATLEAILRMPRASGPPVDPPAPDLHLQQYLALARAGLAGADPAKVEAALALLAQGVRRRAAELSPPGGRPATTLESINSFRAPLDVDAVLRDLGVPSPLSPPLPRATG